LETETPELTISPCLGKGEKLITTPTTQHNTTPPIHPNDYTTIRQYRIISSC
jgi:hypothetical protein